MCDAEPWPRWLTRLIDVDGRLDYLGIDRDDLLAELALRRVETGRPLRGRRLRWAYLDVLRRVRRQRLRDTWAAESGATSAPDLELRVDLQRFRERLDAPSAEFLEHLLGPSPTLDAAALQLGINRTAVYRAFVALRDHAHRYFSGERRNFRGTRRVRKDARSSVDLDRSERPSRSQHTIDREKTMIPRSLTPPGTDRREYPRRPSRSACRFATCDRPEQLSTARIIDHSPVGILIDTAAPFTPGSRLLVKTADGLNRRGVVIRSSQAGLALAFERAS
ncbi:MAG: hypothetical protein IV100_04550 [Myxococcales bacterium]|nr:hypothetical protein [Myxococcales bacterium]